MNSGRSSCEILVRVERSPFHSQVHYQSKCQCQVREKQSNHGIFTSKNKHLNELCGEDGKTKSNTVLQRCLHSSDHSRPRTAFRSQCLEFHYPSAAYCRIHTSSSPPTLPNTHRPPSRRWRECESRIGGEISFADCSFSAAYNAGPRPAFFCRWTRPVQNDPRGGSRGSNQVYGFLRSEKTKKPNLTPGFSGGIAIRLPLLQDDGANGSLGGSSCDVRRGGAPMSISVACPGCNKKLKAKDELAGSVLNVPPAGKPSSYPLGPLGLPRLRPNLSHLCANASWSLPPR